MRVVQSTLIPSPIFCFPLEMHIVGMQWDPKTRRGDYPTQTMKSFHLTYIFFGRSLWGLKLLRRETKEPMYNVLRFRQEVKSLCFVYLLGWILIAASEAEPSVKLVITQITLAIRQLFQ